MKKKTKWVNVVLRQDEWELIKKMFLYFEDKAELMMLSSTSQELKRQYNIISFFNHTGVYNCEDMIEKADKERRKKSRDKSKQKES